MATGDRLGLLLMMLDAPSSLVGTYSLRRSGKRWNAFQIAPRAGSAHMPHVLAAQVAGVRLEARCFNVPRTVVISTCSYIAFEEPEEHHASRASA
jgi:hypothetical protein